MTPPNQKPENACSRPELAALLAVWNGPGDAQEDELADGLSPAIRRDLEEHVSACTSCSARWNLLTEALSWLEGAERGCPSAEALYDYGRGPGFRELDRGEQKRIDRHVASCAECSTLVATLAKSPPVPWEVLPEAPAEEGMAVHSTREAPGPAAGAPAPSNEAPPEPAPVEGPAPDASPRPTPSLRQRDTVAQPRSARPRRFARPRWFARPWATGLAAAAGLLLLARLFFGGGGQTVEGSGSALVWSFPEAPVLRGPEAEGLLHPRGKLRALDEPRPLRFEIDLTRALAGFEDLESNPAKGVERVRVTLRRHGGSAFDEGELVGIVEGDPEELVSIESLAPGHYTWEAWVRIDGLERRLGARDFRVLADPQLEAELARLARLDEPERTSARLALLDEQGYWTDARDLARSLPPSPERDRYLEARGR